MHIWAVEKNARRNGTGQRAGSSNEFLKVESVMLFFNVGDLVFAFFFFIPDQTVVCVRFFIRRRRKVPYIEKKTEFARFSP